MVDEEEGDIRDNEDASSSGIGWLLGVSMLAEDHVVVAGVFGYADVEVLCQAEVSVFEFSAGVFIEV